jgi:hypothetical protein
VTDPFNEFLEGLQNNTSDNAPTEPSADSRDLAKVLWDRMAGLMSEGFERQEAFALLALILQIQARS